MRCQNIRIAVALLIVLASHPSAAGQAQASKPADETSGAAATSTSAAVPLPAEPPQSRWQLGLALGYGLRTNPLVQSDDIPILVDIDIAWFGDHFFFDNGDLGLTFVDNEYVTTSLVARVNSDRVFFGRTDTKFVVIDLAGAPLSSPVELTIPDRDYAAELGLELLADGRWGLLQLTAHHDVSGTHEGYEVEFDYLNNYYWGVRADEANVALPEYTAGSGVNAFARLQFSYQMSRNWNFSFVGEVERMNDEAAASPIVKEQNVFGYFAGFGYRFK
jgi:outer membrane protein